MGEAAVPYAPCRVAHMAWLTCLQLPILSVTAQSFFRHADYEISEVPKMSAGSLQPPACVVIWWKRGAAGGMPRCHDRCRGSWFRAREADRRQDRKHVQWLWVSCRPTVWLHARFPDARSPDATGLSGSVIVTAYPTKMPTNALLQYINPAAVVYVPRHIQLPWYFVLRCK